ncbi:MAG: hypothetical protein P8Q48_17710 [Paracoccaceae bacterium]|nr:hypothetical protein [Paracoccaceae bacterium]MDG1372042.1 hypothetical protein [Paracoccaceae bacterium]
MKLLAPFLLMLTAAGFGWIAALPWLGVSANVSQEGEVSTPAPMALPTVPAPATAGEIGAFQKRPLFSAARRPPPPEAPGEPIEDPMANMLFGRYEIAGVVKLGDKAVAMLRDATDGTLLRIRVGDRVGDADVVDITLESLTFRNGGDTVVAPVKGVGTE